MGIFCLDACKEAGVNTKYIRRLPVKGGHTMIQVDKNAQNCIILIRRNQPDADQGICR